ncbi:MAG: hypothetical protein V7632_530 [Bradyrhizobium sp.]|jgi:kynurenine formamidase
MLNLITPESRQAILGAADPRKIYDLSVDNFVGMPGWFSAGDQPYQMWMTHTPEGEVVDDRMGVGVRGNTLVSYSGDAISMYTHTGTHIDALNHFGYGGVVFNGFSSREHMGSRDWRKAGADKHPPIFARGIMLDVPIRTVRMRYWPDHATYLPEPPGLTHEGAEFLAQDGAAMIGADNHTLEQIPSADAGNWQVVHTYLLTEAGVPILEMANLEDLAADGVFEFVFFGACIRLRGATGAPMRPVAIPIRG